MRLLQLINANQERRVGLIKEPEIVLLKKTVTSTYQLFTEITNKDKEVNPTVDALTTKEKLEYDPIYKSKADWTILSPIDCPNDPMQCILSGTGLTHKASAENRNNMHESQKSGQLTDSMQMYLWGEEGGKPSYNAIGVQPEWFYKGNGHHLKAHGQLLKVPNYADDGGEEPEISGIYLISEQGHPYRIGFAQANEFSDHIMEKKNYLYLAPSKLRNCSVGPELVLNENFRSIPGKVSILRQGETCWSKEIHSGEEAMAHSLANLEYHHFKYAQHRIPGQLHIHFFGAGAFSFGDNVMLEDGDEMQVNFKNMGRPLINPIHIDKSDEIIPEIRTLK